MYFIRKNKKKENKPKVKFASADDEHLGNFLEENEFQREKPMFLKTIGDHHQLEGGKFRMHKEDLKVRISQEVIKSKSLRKYTTDSPDFKKKHYRRESIDRFDNLNTKLPIISKKSPFLKSFNDDIHSKSVSPVKLRQGRLFVDKEREYNYSKMYLPSILIFFFFVEIKYFFI